MLPKNPNLTSFLTKYLLSFILIATYCSVNAQKSDKYFDEADKYYQEGRYEKAAKLYMKVVDIEDYSERAYIQLARSFEKIQNYNEAEQYFNEIFVKTDSVDPRYLLEYGELLMKLGENDRARSYFVSYNNLMEQSDPRVMQYIHSIEDREHYFYDSSFIQLSRLIINGATED